MKQPHLITEEERKSTKNVSHSSNSKEDMWKKVVCHVKKEKWQKLRGISIFIGSSLTETLEQIITSFLEKNKAGISQALLQHQEFNPFTSKKILNNHWYQVCFQSRKTTWQKLKGISAISGVPIKNVIDHIIDKFLQENKIKTLISKDKN